MVEASPIFRFAQFITFSDYYLFHPLFFQTLLFAFISLSLSGVIVVSILFLLLLVLSVSAIFSFSHSFNSYFVYTFFSRVSVILSSVTMCVCVSVCRCHECRVCFERARKTCNGFCLIGSFSFTLLGAHSIAIVILVFCSMQKMRCERRQRTYTTMQCLIYSTYVGMEYMRSFS